jgi:hypothetical protein
MDVCRPFIAAMLAVAGGSAAAPAAAQTIALDRPGVAFYALVGGANPTPQSVGISNRASAALTWRLASTPPAWLTVSPSSGAAPERLSFAASVAGLAPGIYRTTVVISSNDPLSPAKSVPVTLTVVAPPAGHAVYAVAFTFTGYTGLIDGFPDCAVNPKGTDTLVGIVTGREDAGRDEDVEYRGTLMRLTMVDFCETRGRRGPDDDERLWCAATLIGTATMNIELTVYGEADRGGYLKTRHDGGPSTSSVTGTCHERDQIAIERDYPGGNEGGGATPNGQPIDEATTDPRLFSGGRARLVVGSFPPQTRDGWTLRVIEKLR